MAVLNKNQEAFANAFVKRGNLARAWYEISGKTEAEVPLAQASKYGSRLMAASGVEERIAEIRDMHAKEHGVTVASISAQYDEDRKFARESGNASAAVSATTGKAKLYGLLVDKKDVAVAMRPEDARAIVESFVQRVQQ